MDSPLRKRSSNCRLERPNSPRVPSPQRSSPNPLSQLGPTSRSARAEEPQTPCPRERWSQLPTRKMSPLVEAGRASSAVPGTGNSLHAATSHFERLSCMRPDQVEAWTLDIIEAVTGSRWAEDSRVELKSGWLPPEKAARRLAAHANAARGQPILWLVGLDERTGVVGAAPNDLASWWPQVQSRFDGPAPRLAVDRNVDSSGKTVVALLFEPNEPPYVVRTGVSPTGTNPATLEVPWREGTSTRTATRADLLRVLSPVLKLPDVEVLTPEAMLEGALASVAEYPGSPSVLWTLVLPMYVTPQSGERVIIPVHRCTARLRVPESGVDVAGMNVRFDQLGSSSESVSPTPHEVVFSGPGRVNLTASGLTNPVPSHPSQPAHVEVILLPVGADIPLVQEVTFTTMSGASGSWGRWSHAHVLAPPP
jgi:hypothetical protein